MPEESEPLFEQSYQRREKLFGAEPLLSVERNLDKFAPGTVIDLGSGDGRNALYLAKQGFEVLAVDNAPTGIEHLQRYAEEAGVQDSVTGVVADIAEFVPEGEYDNMLSTFTLHFLTDADFARVIAMMQQYTRSGGVNLVQDFLKGDSPHDPADMQHWLDSGELSQLYEAAGWTVLDYGETQHEMIQTNAAGHRLARPAAVMIARKP